MTFTRTIFIALTLAILTGSSQAAVLISDFSSGNFPAEVFLPMAISWNNGTSDQYTQSATFISITSVGGGNPTGEGYFEAQLPGGAAADFTTLPSLSLTAQVDTGNASSTLDVLFFDNNNTEVASATFAASSFSSSFSTLQTALVLTGAGNLTKVTYWRIGGDGVASDSFRFSLDNLVAVPEPASNSLIIAGLVSLFAVAGRKSRRGLHEAV